MQIEQLKEMATFSEEKLNQTIDNALGSYEPSQQFVFLYPNELLKELKTLFATGWDIGSPYTHIIHLPSYYGLWLIKPLHQQESEKLQLAAEVKTKYLEEVEHYQREYVRLRAEQALQLEKEKQARTQEQKDSQKLEELMNQFAKEFN